VSNEQIFVSNSIRPNDQVRLQMISNYACLNVNSVTSNSITIEVNEGLQASTPIFMGCKNPGFVFTVTSNVGDKFSILGTDIVGVNELATPYVVNISNIVSNDARQYTLVSSNTASSCSVVTVTTAPIVCPCTGDSVKIDLNVKIVGTDEGCDGESYTYSITGITNSISYDWKIPAYAKEIVQDANSITLDFRFSPTLSDTLLYNYVNKCEVAGKLFYVIDKRADCDLKIPKAFTPDDQLNIVWQIKGIERYQNCDMKVFNRWGSIVFDKKNGYNNDWNGSYNGVTLPAGTYYYVLDLKNGNKKITGNVTVLK